MPITITDTKFADLKAKLRELFELDKSDLDFGIYRIMAAKNEEVTEFLDRQLKDVVQQTLTAHGAGATDQVQAELDKAIQQAQSLGADPDSLPKVKELRGKLEAAGGASAAELEADIYNHLLAFFSRYYDEGDFISKRRYKGDVYAIPYGGEEVTLHWANKDQYYIKSGEWHKDYRFKVGGKTVRFKLVEATQETNNNKEPDDAKRRYILDTENPVETTDAELTLRFQFRVATEAQKQAVHEASRIFGGKYDAASGRTKGDEREQFCADAEQRALAAMPEVWKPVVTAIVATDTKPARTILGKHLDHFTARNTFDYFIHKDLGGFLRREIDFYIKNEVVRLDDLESLPADHLARVQGKVKAIRAVAGRIIDFLASLEDFQKKMWLKKKLVLNTNWLVTIDRIPVGLRDIVAANAAQWKEWETLGFKPAAGDAMLVTGPKWGTREYLDTNDKLVVDTRFLGAEFRAGLVASDEILVGAELFDEAISGLMIASDNFQALRTLEQRYKEVVDCIYIDPPYNTAASSIAYKNEYKDSSWLALINNRVVEAQGLLTANGITCVAIDDVEFARMKCMFDAAFGKDAVLGVAAVRSNPAGRSTPKGFAEAHEYAVFLAASECSAVGRVKRNERQLARYSEQDQDGVFEWVNFRKHGGREATRVARPRMFYPIFAAAGKVRLPRLEWNKAANAWDVLDKPQAGEEVLWPLNDAGQELRWKWGSESFAENLKDFCSRPVQSGKTGVYMKSRMKAEGMLPVTWWDDKAYSATEYGTNLLKRMFGNIADFSFPKALGLVVDALRAAGATPGAVVLDFFAGSGTTGHAVIKLNREYADEKSRMFLLAEMGAYFHTVLKPRIAKALYSPDWKDGKAQVHGKGTSALVKYFALESYEDALNNLPAPVGELLASADQATKDAMITYSLDLEMGPNLLNLDAFSDPWGYTINAQPTGETEIKPHSVDLVETFNYLLGLKVKAYGPIERYMADFERVEHADNLGRLKVAGRLRRDQAGLFVFQRVEGELLDGTRVLVVWRRLSDDAEQDAAALEAWMSRHREETKERSEHRDYHLIYINGPVTLPQPTAEIRTVLPIEQTFKDRMFAETNGVQHG